MIIAGIIILCVIAGAVYLAIKILTNKDVEADLREEMKKNTRI